MIKDDLDCWEDRDIYNLTHLQGLSQKEVEKVWKNLISKLEEIAK